MTAEIVHAGFDYLKFSVQTDIPHDLRKTLQAAKLEAIKSNCESLINCRGLSFTVRRNGGAGFSVSSGELGAEWYFQDPQNKAKNNPGILIDFRAVLLAIEGIEGAKKHFEDSMAALAIPYEEHQLKVTRVDFAVDILAPWFEPEWECVVAPAGTGGQEHAEFVGEGSNYSERRVTGLRAGQGVNRQLTGRD